LNQGDDGQENQENDILSPSRPFLPPVTQS